MKTDIPQFTVLKAYATAAQNLTETIKDTTLTESLVLTANVVAASFKNGGKLLICGNGGSHCSALHIAEEFTGRFRKDRSPLPTIALGEATHSSCVGNDYGFEYGLARQVTALWQPNDVLLVLSTSGNSKNLVNAVQATGHVKLGATVGFLGRGGGELKDLLRVACVFPGDTSDRIQELQMLAGHLLVELVERSTFPSLY